MKAIYLFSLLTLLFWGCCKPPPVEMYTSQIPNTYTGLDSLYARMANGDSITIVCYGNSITYGMSVTTGLQVEDTYPEMFQALLRQEYGNPNINVINEGHPGWTAEMAAGGLDTLVLPHQPDLVTLIYGINDLYQEKGLANYRQNVEAMVQTLRQQGIAVLVMSPTPLYNRENKELLNYCIEANQIAIDNNVAFFNMHKAMVDRIYEVTDDPLTLMPDEVHYTDNGYRLIGDELIKYWRAKP